MTSHTKTPVALPAVDIPSRLLWSNPTMMLRQEKDRFPDIQKFFFDDD
jgi:hypothetical protein